MGNLSKYYDRSEFECPCGCGFNTVDYELLQILKTARISFQAPVEIESGCRCEKYNRKIGGSENSQHLTGKAADINIIGSLPIRVYNYFDILYLDLYGLGLYDLHTHIDVRSYKARWTGESI